MAVLVARLLTLSFLCSTISSMLVKSKVFTRAEDVWNESLYKEAYADDEAGEDYAEWENTEGRVAISASDWVDYLN